MTNKQLYTGLIVISVVALICSYMAYNKSASAIGSDSQPYGMISASNQQSQAETQRKQINHRI